MLRSKSCSCYKPRSQQPRYSSHGELRVDNVASDCGIKPRNNRNRGFQSFQPGTPMAGSSAKRFTCVNLKDNLKMPWKNPAGRKTTVSNTTATCRLRADPTGSESPNPGMITAVDSKVVTAKDPPATNDYAPQSISTQEESLRKSYAQTVPPVIR